MADYRIICADVLDGLATLPDASVHCVVTSPPYWGLRDYGTGTWEGGDPACDHRHQLGGEGIASAKQNDSAGTQTIRYRDICGKCGARRVDRQLGLEPTISAYVDKQVEVMREVRRVLRDDGVCFYNIGDSYASSGACGNPPESKHQKQKTNAGSMTMAARKPTDDLKPKDLCGVPWRVALALQADDWWWRSVIPWVKRNAMPESVTDRFSTNTEWVFLFTKSARYFWDAEAVRVPRIYNEKRTKRVVYDGKAENTSTFMPGNPGGRNRRNGDAWYESYAALMSGGALGAVMDGDEMIALDVNPEGYTEAHFATFPTRLVRPLIMAGTSEKGCCPSCGAPWVRMVETEYVNPRNRSTNGPKSLLKNHVGSTGYAVRLEARRSTTGWRPTCSCDAGDPVPCTVLEPFSGSGTTVAEAVRLGRRGIGIELSPAYVELSERRIRKVLGVVDVKLPGGEVVRQGSLFGGNA